MKNANIEISLEFLEAFHQVKAKLARRTEADSLSLQQLFVLYFLYKQGHVLMGAVAKQLHCDASNVTGIVDRLVSRKLIVRHEREEDRRAKELTLTTKGRDFIEELLTELPTVLGFNKLSLSDQNTLRQLFSQINTD